MGTYYTADPYISFSCFGNSTLDLGHLGNPYKTRVTVLDTTLMKACRCAVGIKQGIHTEVSK